MIVRIRQRLLVRNALRLDHIADEQVMGAHVHGLDEVAREHGADMLGTIGTAVARALLAVLLKLIERIGAAETEVADIGMSAVLSIAVTANLPALAITSAVTLSLCTATIMRSGSAVTCVAVLMMQPALRPSASDETTYKP